MFRILAEIDRLTLPTSAWRTRNKTTKTIRGSLDNMIILYPNFDYVGIVFMCRMPLIHFFLFKPSRFDLVRVCS